MNTDKNSFPVYRKYKGINTWFRIDSERRFTEIKMIGSKYILHQVEANQFPEMLFIQDMINCADGRWEELSENEFHEVKKKTST